MKVGEPVTGSAGPAVGGAKTSGDYYDDDFDNLKVATAQFAVTGIAFD